MVLVGLMAGADRTVEVDRMVGLDKLVDNNMVNNIIEINHGERNNDQHQNQPEQEHPNQHQHQRRDQQENQHRHQNQQYQHQNQHPQHERVLFVSDLNAKYHNLQQLKPGSIVTKAKHYTVQEAAENIPRISNPNSVVDIVFQLGLNDVRRGTSAEKIKNDFFDLLLHYQNHFPNARLHITGLPPLSNEHKDVTKKLHKLSQNLEMNFISLRTFEDKKTGRIRENTMEERPSEFHYNKYGTSLLAREIKKSLYSSNNLHSGTIICRQLLGIRAHLPRPDMQ